MATKRKAEISEATPPAKRAATTTDIKSHFRNDLFSPNTLSSHKTSYASSRPYQHGVIQDLIQHSLLRSVRSEITHNISFTPKETDIYKIHQSGDLANLDGLDPAALKLLPSLVTLRDALYSRDFREYLSEVTGAGKLSGKKTDMAVNVYTPGCHLLCHDDVIGSRRVSYILYLMDPDKPWREEWGGALRLYPTREKTNKGGQKVHVPEPDHTVSIPPAFSQLSFFAVQPGLSYHDVEEVYARRDGEEEVDDGGRVRMAISGWYHIPQEGEEGYEQGAEARQAERSSRAQLQGRADEFEAPHPEWIDVAQKATSEDIKEAKEKKTGSSDLGSDQGVELTEADLEFLIQYLNPRYLTPDTVLSLRESFTEDSSLRLAMFLSPKFAPKLRKYVQQEDTKDQKHSVDQWQTARPPHKHRYLYRQASEALLAVEQAGNTPIRDVFQSLLTSMAFKKWLSLATGLTLGQCDVIARRFRRGKDYSLATSYNDEDPQLEICLGITPTDGWGAAAEDELLEDGMNGDTSGEAQAKTNGESIGKANGHIESNQEDTIPASKTGDDNVGGYEAYLAGDDDDDADSHVDAPANPSSATGAGQRRSGKADPAVYQAGGEEDEDDDGVLFNQPASWNTLTVVLRDKGTMRFVKYVSASAPGNRWDVCGAWKVTGSLDESDEEESEEDEGVEDEVDSEEMSTLDEEEKGSSDSDE